MSFVYFMQAGDEGAIKIGLAGDPNARLATMQTASPVKLTLLGTCAGHRSCEARFHAAFHSSNLRGEWFQPTPELLAAAADPIGYLSILPSHDPSGKDLPLDARGAALVELRRTREQIAIDTAELTEEIRLAARAAYAAGMSGAQIAKHLGISRQAVNRIYLPKTKTRRGAAGVIAAALVVAMLGLTACGGGGSTTTSSGYTPTSLAQSVTHELAKNGRLTGLVCVKVDGGNVYRCSGDFTPSLASVKKAMSGYDTSGFTQADWDVLIQQRSGPTTLEITVGSDGSWVSS